MKAVRIEHYLKDHDEIEVTDISIPESRDGDVIVKVEAAGVNFVDLLYCRGKHQNNHRKLVTPPFTLGLEFSGTVITSTPSSPYPVGSRVFGTALGSFASYISVSPSTLHPLPNSPHFTLQSSSSLAATAPVSYGALITRGHLTRNETVLIHGASGGLGLYAVQIAKAIGATVIGTASTPSKCRTVRSFGADHCIDYSAHKDWEKEVSRVTSNRGVDLVFDSVGLVEQSLKCLKPRGRVLVVGFAGREGNLEKLPVNKILLKQAIIIGYRFGETNRTDPAETERIWKELNCLIEEGKIRPAVYDKEYIGLESVKEAMTDLIERRVWGKAIVRIGDHVCDTEIGGRKTRAIKL